MSKIIYEDYDKRSPEKIAEFYGFNIQRQKDYIKNGYIVEETLLINDDISIDVLAKTLKNVIGFHTVVYYKVSVIGVGVVLLTKSFDELVEKMEIISAFYG